VAPASPPITAFPPSASGGASGGGAATTAAGLASLAPLALPPPTAILPHGSSGGMSDGSVNMALVAASGSDNTAFVSAMGVGGGMSAASLLALARSKGSGLSASTSALAAFAGGSGAELAAAAAAAGVGFALDAAALATMALAYNTGATGPDPAPGRPAGVSLAEWVPRLLDLAALRYGYPADFDFDGAAAAAGGPAASGTAEGDGAGDEDEEMEDEDVVAVRMMRDCLRRIFVAIVKASPEAALTHLLSTSLALDRLAGLARLPWNDAEATLALLYFVGEGSPATATTALKSATGPLYDAVAVVASPATVTPDTHHAVLVQYLEAVTRYALLAATKPDSLATVLDQFVGGCGLHHGRPSVRSRAAFLLSRYIKTLLRECPPAAAAAIVEPVSDAILAGIAEFLAVPFVPRDGTARGGAGATASSSCASRTRGAAGLGSEDQQYLYEIVGLLLGAPWLAAERKVAYTDAVMTPLITQLDQGIQYLVDHEGGGGGSVGVGGGGGRTVDTSGWSADMVSDVAVWLVRVINAMAFLSKGYGNVSAIPALVDIQERALTGAMRALAVLPTHPHVRNRAVLFLQRLVECLDARLLSYLNDLVPLLLSGPAPDDMTQTLTLFTALAHRFRSAFAAVAAPHFVAIAARVFEVMPPLPAAVPAAAPPPMAGKRRISTGPGSGVSVNGSHSGPGRGAAGSGGGGGGGVKGAGSGSTHAAAPSRITAVAPASTDESRARVELQRAFTVFLHAVIADGLAADLLASPHCAPQLVNLLGSLPAMASGTTDMSVAKSLVVNATLLVRAWLPVTPFTAIAPPPHGGGSGGSVSHTIATTYGVPQRAPTPAVAGDVPAVPCLDDYTAAAAASPVGDVAIVADFVGLCLDAWLRLPFAAATNPWWHDRDAQSLYCVTEGVGLLLTLAVHTTAHARTSAATASLTLPSFTTHLCGTVLPGLGVDSAAAAALGSAVMEAVRLPPPDAFSHPPLHDAMLTILVGLRLATQAAL